MFLGIDLKFHCLINGYPNASYKKSKVVAPFLNPALLVCAHRLKLSDSIPSKVKKTNYSTPPTTPLTES